MTNQLLGVPLWAWVIVVVVVAGIVGAAVSTAIARARRSSSGSLRRQLTPGGFRVFLDDEPSDSRGDRSGRRPS